MTIKLNGPRYTLVGEDNALGNRKCSKNFMSLVTSLCSESEFCKWKDTNKIKLEFSCLLIYQNKDCYCQLAHFTKSNCMVQFRFCDLGVWRKTEQNLEEHERGLVIGDDRDMQNTTEWPSP